MVQPSVGDPGVGEVQLLQLRQPFQVYQPGIGDLGAVEVQRFKLCQPFQVCQSCIGDPDPDPT